MTPAKLNRCPLAGHLVSTDALCGSHERWTGRGFRSRVVVVELQSGGSVRLCANGLTSRWRPQYVHRCNRDGWQPWDPHRRNNDEKRPQDVRHRNSDAWQLQDVRCWNRDEWWPHDVCHQNRDELWPQGRDFSWKIVQAVCVTVQTPIIEGRLVPIYVGVMEF